MALLCVVLVVCMLISQAEARVVRVRRQDCQDGTYEHDGRTCCRCPAGHRVEAHCTGLSQTLCEPCLSGTEYQSHANSLTTCEPCTSCEQPNANLEVDRKCTPIVNARCKCKENHYCPNGAAPCKICEPCLVCGSEGIRVECSATNNTICHDKPQDNTVAITLGTLVAVGALGASGAALFYFLKKRKSGSKTIQNGNEEMPEESVQLQPKLEPLGQHIPQIAEVIGWQIMRNLAIKSKISDGKIQSCELDYRTDSNERTIALLRIWEEKESKSASSKLIQYLRQTGQNKKADEVQEILSGGGSS